MIVTEFLPARPSPLWQYARQMGIRHVIVKAAPELTGLKPPWDIDALRTIQRGFADAGLIVHGLEGDEFDMNRIKLGLDGRDDDIALYQQMLRNMGELGIPLLCYNFMPVIGWCRTRTDLPGRGGALLSSFDLRQLPTEPTAAGIVSADRIWSNYEYFITRVMPVAEAAGVKMGLHPDDPPLPSLRGVSRIFASPESFARAYALAPSSSNGVTFCRANFKLMGGDVSGLIRQFARDNRLFFLHLRDVRGTADCFDEVFHDEAAGALIETLRVCKEAGFDGPLRCDHVATLAGEANDQPGYGALGRLFADGYVLGLMDALGIDRQ